MPDLERNVLGYFARPHPIPNHQEGKMEECLINFNKVEDNEGCLKFCNILKLSKKYYRKVA